MRYELYKLLKNRLLFVGIILSVVLTFYQSYERGKYLTYRYDSYSEKYSEEVKNELNGKFELWALRYKLTKKNGANSVFPDEMYERAGYTKEEAVSFTDGERQEIFDWFEYYLILSGRADSCQAGIDYRKKVVRNADRLRKTADTYQRRTNEKLFKMYADDVDYVVSDQRLSDDFRTQWYDKAYSDYINIMLVLLAVCIEFLTEHRNNTFQMVYSSYEGRGKTYIRKVMVIAGFTTLLSLVTTLLMHMRLFTDARAGEFLKMDFRNYYIHSPYKMNFLQFIVDIWLLRLLGYLVLSMFFTMLAVLSKKSLLPFVAGVSAGCGGYELFDRLLHRLGMLRMNNGDARNVYHTCELVRKYTPFGVIRQGIDYLTEYEPNNVLGCPITTLTIAVVVSICYILLFLVAGCIIYLKRFRKKGV